MGDKVFIFDTTLRDGEQSPGASMTVKEKVEFALQLERLNVDVIEGGFPISSQGDFESVKLIAENLKKTVIAGLCRAREADIKRCADALKAAKHPRIHTFIATSDIHVEKKLKKSKDEVISYAVNAVKYAKSFVDDVEFSPEDASRTGKQYLCDIIEAVIDAGATVINVADTVGYSNPFEFGHLIEHIYQNVSNINKAIISVHCHDDLGLSVANSLSAIRAGARQVECTINGIGERAGNAALEEIVMNLRVRPEIYNNAFTDIVTSELFKTSRMLSRIIGAEVPSNKAIIGTNAFAHESGIHQDGVLKERTTYEIMSPESVGWVGSNMVLGKHSGRHAFKERLKALGFASLADDEIERAFTEFKKLADKKKEVYDDDLVAILEERTFQVEEGYHLDYLHTISGANLIPTATLRLMKGDELKQQSAYGDGPVDAAYKAIEQLLGVKGILQKYKIDSITRGKDALGEANVVVDFDGTPVRGRGHSTDIVEASAKAYLNAVNKYLIIQEKRKNQSKIDG